LAGYNLKIKFEHENARARSFRYLFFLIITTEVKVEMDPSWKVNISSVEVIPRPNYYTISYRDNLVLVVNDNLRMINVFFNLMHKIEWLD